MRQITQLHLTSVDVFRRDPKAVNEYLKRMERNNPYLYELIRVYFEFIADMDFEQKILRAWLAPLLWLIEPPLLTRQDLQAVESADVLYDFWEKTKLENPLFVEYFEASFHLLIRHGAGFSEDELNEILFRTLSIINICSQVIDSHQCRRPAGLAEIIQLPIMRR